VPAVTRIVLASSNPGKIREIADLLADLGITVIPQSDLNIESPPETGVTFVENALIKARYAAQQSGLPAMADDSGIAVDALDGNPGVYSARYAGANATDEQNLDKLLDKMSDITDVDRGAGFHCAAVLVCSDETREPLVAEAVWRGTVLRQRHGVGGFGYDPVFYDAAAGKTGAQMSREEKNAVSHRGKAFKQLKTLLQDKLIPQQIST
jgi:XTP/dITP diphosphohydrolase